MAEKNTGKFYQVSTLQALALGFSKSVMTVGELLQHGDLGLGTFIFFQRIKNTAVMYLT